MDLFLDTVNIKHLFFYAYQARTSAKAESRNLQRPKRNEWRKKSPKWPSFGQTSHTGSEVFLDWRTAQSTDL